MDILKHMFVAFDIIVWNWRGERQGELWRAFDDGDPEGWMI